MSKNIFKKIVIISSCFLVFSSLGVTAQTAVQQQNIVIVNSIKEDFFRGGIVIVKGESSPGAKIILSIKNEKNTFLYSETTRSDNNGKWSAELDQPLKKGKYYVLVSAQDINGNISPLVQSAAINVQGPFSLIIGIFSLLVIILLFSFVGILYMSKSGEIKRYKRILASHRDIVASYNVLKKDVDMAKKDLSGSHIEEQKINEAAVLLGRISENLEKMNKYVLQGVEAIGKYDIITKINDVFKRKKTK